MVQTSATAPVPQLRSQPLPNKSDLFKFLLSQTQPTWLMRVLHISHNDNSELYNFHKGFYYFRASLHLIMEDTLL